MNDENGTSAPSTGKPFFDIEQDSSESASQQPPLSGMVMGQVAAQPPPQAASHFGAAQSSLGAPQLSGQVNTFAHGGQQFAELQPQKAGFRWPQFLLGMVVPWIVIIGSTFLTVFLEDDYNDEWDQFYRNETYSVTADSDGWFVQSVSISEGEQLDRVSGCCFDDSATTAEIYSTWGGYYETRDPDPVIVEVYENQSSNQYEENVIGNYTRANQTIWFKLSQLEAEEISIDVSIYDLEGSEKSYNANQNFGEMLFCLLPFAYIIGLVTAFVKGNNALGIGLLCAIPAALVFFPFLFVLLLLAFGF